MAIAAAGCGPNLACICGNDNFFFTLEGVFEKGACTLIEAQGETHLDSSFGSPAPSHLFDCLESLMLKASESR